MIRLDHYERAIIHFLGHRGPANTNKIADSLRMSWATADNRLRRLLRKGYVLRKQGDNLWELRRC